MRITDTLGIDLPIIQAPMAGVQGSALAIAVCEAGGLGSLPCALLSSDSVRRELTAICSHTARPFNVNLFCHSRPAPDPAREATWRAQLAPYYKEFGIEMRGDEAGPSRNPFDEEAAVVLSEFRPPVVSFHFGLPSPALLARVKAWGAKVMSSATTVAEALWLEANGADVIIAQGLEAGGHRGMFLSKDLSEQVGTFALLPQVIRAVKVPVIAAGGVASADAVAAALALGAAGVQVGTAYLLCPEADTSAVHRAALKGGRARHTVLTNLFSGGVARGIPNRLTDDLGSLSPAAPAFPLAANALTSLRRAAESTGRGDFSPLWAGQNVTGCKEIGAAALTRELMPR
ncbi:MAG TPA: nitronate monooxygenase family protein [Steroidobacteraceae bacterium]|nr:nitronate monooxygenase family protein [Steroidobacteraceae bacterium]